MLILYNAVLQSIIIMIKVGISIRILENLVLSFNPVRTRASFVRTAAGFVRTKPKSVAIRLQVQETKSHSVLPAERFVRTKWSRVRTQPQPVETGFEEKTRFFNSVRTEPLSVRTRTGFVRTKLAGGRTLFLAIDGIILTFAAEIIK